MKEISFLKQNAKKWENYEKVIEQEKKVSPAELTEMFIELTNDLSYANTNYAETQTKAYLNSLAERVHHLVYKNKKETGNRIVHFYAHEIPMLFAKHHKQLLNSFLVTCIATLIGVLSQIYDDTFVRLILGDNYVDSTIERIKNGNPIGIYGEGNQFYMFVAITINNIRVSFIAFVFGIFTAFGTSLLLVQNGIMLGSFFAMFYQYNVLDQALKVVWIHGTLEISAIIIAGCAGFILGNSFVFPKTHTRFHSFKEGGKTGLKIVIGLVPVFIMAGFLESFVTRYTEMPLALSLVIIGGSFAFIAFYFIILPIILKNKNLKHA
ncbi:MAG: stage II sporulation protein M [Sphingobacteriaceae bacterium]|nr:stage II sporulation protein M [Sphingobacteriaceae bacterium]